VRRLGKHNCAIIDYLEQRGGDAHIEDLAEAAHKRPRDLRRRNLAKLAEAGIVAVDGDTVRLAADWSAALARRREADGELEADERDRKKYREQSRKYRNRDRTPADKEAPLMGKAAVARILEARRKEEKQRWVDEQRRKVGETAATFLVDELEGVTAVRYQDVRRRWVGKGGRVEDLRAAVHYGPFRFKREADGDLYVFHEDGQDRPAGPNDRLWRERQAKHEEPHPWDCDCPEHGPEPSYVRYAGGAS
jgi:hypothetical protein